MKIAMMSYTMARGAWGQTSDVAELCRFTQQLGLDAIDWVTVYDHDPHEVRRITEDFGLSNACYTFITQLHSPDPATRSAALDRLAPELETAAALGTDKVMAVVGRLPGVSRDEARPHALDGLARAVELGSAAGITVTIENFPGADSPFCVSADVNAAVAAVPGLKVTFDNGNVVTGGEDPAEGFTNSAEHVVHAHFKDWRLADDGLVGLDGRCYRGALVGEGMVLPEPCLRAMKEASYKGYIDFEYEGDEYTPDEALRRGVPRLQATIDAVMSEDT